MKQPHTFYTLCLLLCFFYSSSGQTLWTGEKIIFQKFNGADWTLEANQDRITDNVWITRQDNKGLFNIAQESSHQIEDGVGPSPIDTEWAFGSINDGVENLNFTTWGVAHTDENGGNPPSLLNRDMVLHLISDDIYIDIKLTAWTEGGLGGGFRYERSTDQTSNTSDLSLREEVNLYPNPSSDFIQLSKLDQTEVYRIFSISGTEVSNGTVSKDQKIDISHLSEGIYVLMLENGVKLEFRKGE